MPFGGHLNKDPLTSVADPDPHYFRKLDPDPY
jgi:hypothetical protein